jgi:DNA-binding GntR family transcriptional regulator
MSGIDLTVLRPGGTADSLALRAYEQIKEALLGFELRPGEILAGPRLAERYGMSRTPVHEALKLHCNEGFLRVVPRVGYVVSAITMDDAQEIFQLRTSLEALGAELASQRVTPSDLQTFAELEEASRETVRMLTPDNPSYLLQAINANRDFHVLLATLSGNARLVQVVRRLLDESQRIIMFDPRLRAGINFESMSDEHRGIVRALADHDRDAARQRVAEHIQGTENRVATSIVREPASVDTGDHAAL